jgi:hypothetical protein
MKSVSYAAYAAVSAILVSTPVLAGAPMHRLEAALPAYELKLDGQPQIGKPLYLSLVERDSGKPVADGEVAVLRRVFRGPKAVPAIQYELEALPRTADGRFECASEHHAVQVTLRGAGPAGHSPVWLTIHS